ncbi:MAG: dCTP deaminase [Candidatus Schekmanbacteria bacterium]|nr:MAG: dCTP deaminase [Candidatus Schekmanbacteria bacterium]
MPVKNDEWIKRMSLERGMIEPFCEKLSSNGVISYGLSSYGYDIRLFNEFKVINDTGKMETVDPKDSKRYDFETIKTDVFEIKPGQTVLGRSLEYFRIPRNVIVLCFGKSTYARCGILVNITPLEPEWEGYITIAISNISLNRVKLYALEGISQIVFIESDETCLVSYADRKGKYQAQKEITSAKV